MKLQLASLYLAAAPFVGVAAGGDYAAQVLSDGPVVYYRFDEPDAGDAFDRAAASGRPQFGAQHAANHGPGESATGALAAESASSNLAAAFREGRRLAVELPADPDVLDLTGPLSVELWVQPSGSGSGHQNLVSKGHFHDNADDTYTSGQVSFFLLYLKDKQTGRLRFGFADGAGAARSLDANYQFPAGEWTHVVATYDRSTSRAAIYINGQLDIERRLEVRPPSFPGQELSIGALSFDRTQRRYEHFFHGALDEVAVYDYVLDHKRIAAHYSLGSGMEVASVQQNGPPKRRKLDAPIRDEDQLPVADEGPNHWAYRPVVRPELPAVAAASGTANPIDLFVAARLESDGLRMNPPATREVLLRRVYLDLIGLPPDLDEVDAFLADDSPGAYEKVVDRLLASPHYGEHGARYWLDLARYGDTNGYNIDVRRSIWPYRDWVINALNSGMPFDQFTIEQIAGDLLPNATRAQRIATGFHRNTMVSEEAGVDPEEYRVKAIVDRVNTTATVWLGTTLECSQCHDHFYDPFTQSDYFRLYAFFNNTEDDAAGPRTRRDPVVHMLSPEQEAERQRIRVEIGQLGKDQNELRQKLQKAEADLLKAAPSTLVMKELAEPRTTRVHMRGDFLDLGDEVSPGVPEVLRPIRHSAVQRSHSAVQRNRLDLARWLVGPDNPLTPRVTVNWQWQRFFGTGLVSTSSDFGNMGAAPSHPELLDWLATELVDSGWDVKHIHRLIVTSATYRQSASRNTRPRSAGEDEKLLAGSPRFRLDAEAIRDVALSVSGLLNTEIGGESVYPPQPSGLWLEDGAKGFGMDKWPASTGAGRYRRGIYTFWRRSTAYPSFTVFDAPSREHCVVRRARTNTPLQALVTLNDPVFVECAVALALRTMRRGGDTAEDRITYAFRLCVSRRPKPAELDRLVALYNQQRDGYGKNAEAGQALIDVSGLQLIDADVGELAAWAIVVSVLLNLDETITRG